MAGTRVAIEDADGAFLNHEDLRRAIAAEPDLAERAVAAAASPDYGWKRASLFLGNAVAHWSRAWTEDSNPYSSRFEREGHEARIYRYRLRSTPSH